MTRSIARQCNQLLDSTSSNTQLTAESTNSHAIRKAFTNRQKGLKSQQNSGQKYKISKITTCKF